MSVSVVTTVKDEERTLSRFLGSLLAQSRPADEIVIVDGGSSDRTPEVLADLARSDGRIRVLDAPGASIAAGRNVAIAHARGDLIAVADAGTVAHGDWLERLVRPLEREPEAGVSAGYFLPAGDTWFERTLSAVITPHLGEVDPARFLPSSRSVAFRRQWWERVGGYPEWLRHCEDLVFDLALKDAGATFRFVPGALVEWSARATLGAYFRQYLDYGRGDGLANLWPARHLARYSAYAAGLVLLAAATRTPVAALALAFGAALHVGPFYRRLWRHRPFATAPSMALASTVVPAIVVVGDIGKMIGYPLGRRDRARARSVRRPPFAAGAAP